MIEREAIINCLIVFQPFTFYIILWTNQEHQVANTSRSVKDIGIHMNIWIYEYIYIYIIVSSQIIIWNIRSNRYINRYPKQCKAPRSLDRMARDISGRLGSEAAIEIRPMPCGFKTTWPWLWVAWANMRRWPWWPWWPCGFANFRHIVSERVYRFLFSHQ